LALLVGLAGGGVTALVASWILPMILLVLLVNAVVVVWIYPDYRHRAPITGTPWNLAEIVRFAAASYFARLCTAAAANALPLMVIAYLGDATNASFYMAWTIGLTLEMVVINFSSSLLVQGAQNPAHIPALARVAFRQQAMVLVPAVAVVVVFAREILVVFGEKYADDATTLLRLVALGILPTIGTYLYIPIARLRGRVVEVTLLTALASGGFLALAWFGLRQHGLAGLGVAYLLAQGGLGVLLLPRVFRILTGSAGAPGTASSPADSGSGHLATATAPSTEPPAAADLGLSHQTGGSDRNTASGLGRYRRAQVGRHRARSSDA
jgi:O-antigen/teichoic acid export membrane protein